MVAEDRWELDYAETRDDLVRFLEAPSHALMSLATSHNDRVLVRTISVVADGLDIYFFTWGGSRKCEQIRANPKVALCGDRYQVEGTAEVLGDLFSEHNAPHVERFRRKLPGAIEAWEKRPGMVLVKVRATAAVIAGPPGEEPHLAFLDLIREASHAERWAHH